MPGLYDHPFAASVADLRMSFFASVVRPRDFVTIANVTDPFYPRWWSAVSRYAPGMNEMRRDPAPTQDGRDKVSDVEKPMTRPELRVALDWFCGCGDPAGAAKAVLDILDLHPLYEHWGEFKEIVPGEESIRYVLLYALDAATGDSRYGIKREGWFEHGSSIPGQWLTPEGERVRAGLRREYDLGPDDEGYHFSALFPDGGHCIHGYALGDPGYEEHVCMSAASKLAPTTYTFPVCVPCGAEIDESNEHKHQGDGHDIQRLKLAPVAEDGAVDALVTAATALASAYDGVIDQEFGVEGDCTPTDEAEAVRDAVRALGR